MFFKTIFSAKWNVPRAETASRYLGNSRAHDLAVNQPFNLIYAYLIYYLVYFVGVVTGAINLPRV